MRARNLFLFLTVVALAVCPAFGGSITTIGLFDTGADGTGALLTGGAADSHYLWCLGTSCTPSSNSIVVSPVPSPWLANSGTSQWVSFQQDYTTMVATSNVSYVYTTTFDLTGYVLSSVIITGGWAIDDLGTLSLNGGSALSTIAYDSEGSSYDALHTFTLNQANGLVAGVNTLTFAVTNYAAAFSGNATGLRVQFSSFAGTESGGEIPEPGTLALLGGGLLALGFIRRRH